jgi:MFS family permease
VTLVPDAVTPVVSPTIASVLRRPHFLLLVVGQTISQLGDKLHHMALIALVGAGARAETGGLELAKLSVVFTAPVVLFGPLAGALVDRWNKRLTMVVCDALRAILVLAMPFLYRSTGRLGLVYVAAFFVFLMGTFFNSAKMALIPDLVPKNALLPANAALTSIGRIATVAGIVGGGMIMSSSVWARFGWTTYDAGFYLDSASFMTSVLTLLGILSLSRNRSPASPGIAPPELVQRQVRSLAHDVREAVIAMIHTPGLRFAIASLMLLALFAATVYVAMTLSVQTVMGRGTAGVGYLGGLLAGGMVLGSLVAGSLGSRLRREQMIVWGSTAIGILMVVAGVWFSFRTFAPVAFLGGVLLAPIMVAQDTLLHEHAPAASRAVIFSTRDLLVAGVFAGAAFLVGGAIYLLSAIGVGEPYRLALGLVGGVISLAAMALEVVVLRRRHVL